MPSRHEQLRNLNGTAEDDEEDCQQIMPSLVAQAKCESSCRKNREMFEAMGYARFRPQGRRN